MDEYWKPVNGYEGLYEVSSRGRILVLDRPVINRHGFKAPIRKGHLLHPAEQSRGYKFVYLTKNGEKKRFLVHRLVAAAFIPNVNNAPCVDHIDTDTRNNSVENLRWVSYLENQNNHLTLTHLSEFSKRKKRVGMFSINGDLLEIFESGAAAAREMQRRGRKTNEHIILQICNQRPMKCCDGEYRLRKTTAGYIWKFV